MEPAKIDWKRVESVFVEDNVYENISAPKWVDFLAPDEASVDDVAWFCRPDCKHPNTAEDFLKTPPSFKFLRSLERLPFGDRNQRDTRLKRRGQSQSTFSSNENEKPKYNEDSENQNPNLLSPHDHQVKSIKASIKSSNEKDEMINDTSQNDEGFPRLKSTLSARNLFAGKDILNHITEFCNELKKLATRARERENVEKLNDKSSEVGEKKEVVTEKPFEVLGAVGGKKKERKPLLEMDKEHTESGKERERKPLLEKDKENSEGVDKPSANKDKQRRKKFDEAENIPISLNLENVKKKGGEPLLQIRTNPPSPQCFSAARSATKTTPSKSYTYRSMERRILQEALEQKTPADKGTSVSKSIVEGREARALDVFWFLKPCTLSS